MERLSPSLVEKIYDEVVRLACIDLQQADNLSHAIGWIAKKLDDDRCRAQGRRAAGHVLLSQGKYREALAHYSAALSLFRRLGCEVDIGRTLYGGSLQALIYLGKYDEALAWEQEARAIFVRSGDTLRLARLDINTGNILYRQDRLEEALQHYQCAYEKLGGIGDPHDIAVALRNMAVCYISLADFANAMDTSRKARDHCERHGMSLLAAEIDYNIAYLYFQRGEYSRAIELYQAARKHCEALGDPYHRALCDLDQSEMYLELNLGEEGIQLAKKAAVSFRKLGMRYEEAKSLTNIAAAASQAGNTMHALKIFREARALFSGEKNQVWSAMIDLYEALVLFHDGRDVESMRLCDTAYTFFSRSSLENKASLCELLRARLHLRAQDFSQALHACGAVLERLTRSESPFINYSVHFVLGQINEARQDRDAAFESYKEAHAVLESLRVHLKGEELKIAFLKDKMAIYESLVWLCLSATPGPGDKEAAFSYIEQSKSRSLADLIADRAHSSPSPAFGLESLAEKARDLRAELNLYYRKLEQEEFSGQKQPTGRPGMLFDRMRTCEKRLAQILSELRSSDNSFSILQNAGTVDLETIRSVIPPSGVLLEYYPVREMLYACVIRHAGLEIAPLAPVSRLHDLFRLLQFQLSKFRLGKQFTQRFSASMQIAVETHLRELYDELIAPIRHLLTGEHLVIVPHDFLHALPFHALWDGRSFLIDQIAISYSPSASVYYLCSTRRHDTGDGSLILGIPDAKAPFILNEVQYVASELPNPLLFVAKEATEENLRTHGPQSRYIHVAAHGLFRQDDPMFSSMRLGDSRLSLLDLYSLKLSSELVTLSGCSTGLNAIAEGDELLGLVRGLLCAGTRAVLVTLWDVDDKSAAEFMRLFYGHQRVCPDKAVALQMAMRELRECYGHPYFWAPFVLIGGSAPTKANPGVPGAA